MAKAFPQRLCREFLSRFFTTKPPGEGSGLGLDIVQKILEKHEGELQVESVPGKTKFTISLPIGIPDSN